MSSSSLQPCSLMSRLTEVCCVSETVSATVKHEQKQLSPVNDGWIHSLPSPGVLSPPSFVSPTSTLPRDLGEPLLPPPLPLLSSFAPPVAPGASAPPTITVITGTWNWIWMDSNNGATSQPEHQSLVTTLSDGSLAALSPAVGESSPSPAPVSAPLVSSGSPPEPPGFSASWSSAAAVSPPAPSQQDEHRSALKLLTPRERLNWNVNPLHLSHESLSGFSLFLPLRLLLLPHLLRLVPKLDETPPFCCGADSEDASQTWTLALTCAGDRTGPPSLAPAGAAAPPRASSRPHQRRLSPCVNPSSSPPPPPPPARLPASYARPPAQHRRRSRWRESRV